MYLLFNGWLVRQFASGGDKHNSSYHYPESGCKGETGEYDWSTRGRRAARVLFVRVALLIPAGTRLPGYHAF